MCQSVGSVCVPTYLEHSMESSAFDKVKNWNFCVHAPNKLLVGGRV